MGSPARPIRPPNRSRHALDAINRRTLVKERNSIVMPWVDMTQDTEVIRAGLADQLPDHRFRVNGRTYFVEGNEQGTLVPESGDGVVNLTRAEMRALVTFVKYGGDEERAGRELDADPSVSRSAIDVARALYAQRSTK